MNSLFSFKLWLIFLQRFIDALYPANLIFLIFLYPVRKKIKLSRPVIFILLLLLIDLAIRLVSFFSGIPFAGRYFYPSMIIITIFTGVGMLSFIQFLHRLLVKKFPKMTESHIAVAVFLIILFAYSGKAIHSSNDKKWLRDISSLIKKHISPGERAVILSNYEENRFVYYSGCSEMLLFSPENNFQIRRRIPHGNDTVWQINSNGMKSFKNYINTIPSQLFVIYRIKDSVPPAQPEILFPGMSLIGKYLDKRRKHTYTYLVFQKQ